MRSRNQKRRDRFYALAGAFTIAVSLSIPALTWFLMR